MKIIQNGRIMQELDQLQLNFSNDNIWLLNILLSFIMFGVALEIKPSHFKQLIRDPKPTLVGVFSQFLLLPFLTFLLVLIIRPIPSVALGMILVAACPGGNISNFISLHAKGNAALSVGLTAIATIAAIFMTPLNFSLWGGLYPDTKNLLQEISLNPIDMFKTVLILLGIPLLIGQLVAHYFPKFTHKITRPIKNISFLIFIGFVVIAFSNNIDIFLYHIGAIFVIVLFHNAIALGGGFTLAKIFKLSQRNTRSISIETGIQNSGLGLVLIFNFFDVDSLGGMAIVAGWWGIWHIIAGLGIASFWSKRKLTDENE